MTLRGIFNWIVAFFTFRLLPNRPSHDGDIVEAGSGYKLIVIEFDDQGLCFDRGRAIDGLTGVLEEYKASNPVIVAFVHGWKHNASSQDDNLVEFHKLMANAAAADSSRPVLGVYLAWPGLSLDGNPIWKQASFWGRQSAAARIAQGAPREVLGRLKAFRNGQPGGPPQATLVVVGHSFGALIVYAAIAQSLIEAAASQERIAPSFGDLVVLVNPAFSAVSYMPIWEILKTRSTSDQLPVCVEVTAENDWATRLLYPIGSYYRHWTERWKGRRQRQALTHTMGHLKWLRTHTLSIADKKDSEAAADDTDTDRVLQRRDHARTALLKLAAEEPTQTFGGVTVTRVSDEARKPFWVVSAPKTIIDGHNGIFLPPFIAFLRGLIGAHLEETPKR
jgi:hypothetical protein